MLMDDRKLQNSEKQLSFHLKKLKKKRISRVLVEMWALEALQARGQDRRNMTEIGGKRTLIHNGIKLN